MLQSRSSARETRDNGTGGYHLGCEEPDGEYLRVPYPPVLGTTGERGTTAYGGEERNRADREGKEGR